MPLDIGIGLLIGTALNLHFSLDQPILLPIIGVIFSLLPDVDAVLMHFKPSAKRRMERHRELLHIPLIYLPVGTLLLFIISPIYALLFFLTSLIHFIHDSVGIGWGVRWLYPFSTKSFSFLYHIENNNGGPTLPKRLLYTFDSESIEQLAEKYGDKHWVRNIYGKFHVYAVVEYVVFLIGLMFYVINI